MSRSAPAVRTGAGGRIAVAAVAALGTVCLAGSPLYLSSVATGAVQHELAHTCLADVGVVLPTQEITADELQRLDVAALAVARHTQAPVLSRVASVRVDTGEVGRTPSAAYLLNRPGQEQQLGRAVTLPGAAGVLAPEWFEAPRGVQVGDRLRLFTVGPGGKVAWEEQVRVADTYPAVPTRPEPAYWCGLRALFRSPNSDPADPPIPSLLAGADEVAKVGPASTTNLWEVRPDPRGLSRHDAAVLADRLDSLVVDARNIVVVDTRAARGFHDGAALRAVVRHAGAATAVVAGTMAPVRLAGLLASLALLVAATTLVTRERQRELRLRLLKGEAPAALGLRVARGASPPVVGGGLAGAALALAAVRWFGPAPELERAAERSAGVHAAFGVAAALVVVGVVAATRITVLVDARARRRSRLRFVPWELLPVAAAVAAFERLDRIGGVQQIGAQVAHADLVAQSFPLLAVIAPLAVLARPTVLLVRRWRFAGAALPPSALTGLRRALAEPAVTGGVLLATALAAGSFTLARTLTDSTDMLLHDKASTYVGSDLAITTSAPAAGTAAGPSALPVPFDRTGTVVARLQAHSGDQSVDVLGIDPATFARAVHWRGDAADRSLDDLVGRLAGSDPGPLPAIVVGGRLPDDHLEGLVRQGLDVHRVATARWFPGFHNGAVLVVVDRDRLLATGLATAAEIWLRDPPADAVAQLSKAGVVARSPLDLALVFDVTSFLTVRWAYATLSVLAVLVGVVVLLAQLLVLDARRQSRGATHVLTARMGLGRWGEALGLVAEIAPPLAVGTVLGMGIGWLVALLSVARLDSLRQLQPPARLVVDRAVLVPTVTAMVAAIVLLVLVGVVMLARTRPMEVMRGTA